MRHRDTRRTVQHSSVAVQHKGLWKSLPVFHTVRKTLPHFFGMCINSRTAVGIYRCYHCTALSEMLCCRALTYKIQNQGQYLFEGLPNPPLCSTACSPASELGTLFHLWSHQCVYLEEGIFRITTFCCWIPSKETLWKIHSDKKPMLPAPVAEAHLGHM